MKKYLLIVFITLWNYTNYGQNSQIILNPPEVSPQSPTTSDLGKYGEVDVNESTGIIAPSIPLFTYNAGAISIPITLGYSGNGVKVNEDPTWAGVNWNINPGGVITRRVYDLPDELTPSDYRMFFTEAELENLSGVRELVPNDPDFKLNPNTEWFKTLRKISDELIDSQVDIFNYNFLGYSGSFYLDKNNIVHLIKYDKEISIIFNKDTRDTNKSEIIIKTPDGTTYSFGGITASESSKSSIARRPSDTATNPFTQNSFYLHTISFLNGGKVFFDYQNYGRNLFYKIGNQESAGVSFPSLSFPCNKSSYPIYNTVQNFVFLKKIRNTFNDHYVEFSSSSYGKNNRLLKLNSISLKKGSTAIKKFELKYLTIDNEIDPLEKKIFLKNVDYYNASNTIEYDYELEYNNPESFPSKESFAQDHLGYYNGKNSNITLLPITDNRLLNSSCHFGLADREANLEASLIGTLKSIKYPTAGTTQFEYELPYKGEEPVYTSINSNLYMNAEQRNPSSGPATGDVPNMPYKEFYEYFYPNDGNESLIVNQNNTLFATFTATGVGFYQRRSMVKLIAKNVETNQIIEDVYTIPDIDITNKTYTSTLSINLPTGKYHLKMSLQVYTASSNPVNRLNVNYELKIPSGTKPTYYPGLRIKRITNYSNNNNVNIKRYYYNSRFRLNEESFLFYPYYIYTTGQELPDSSGQLTALYNLSTSSVKNIFYNDMGVFIYDYVTTSYGGDNFENGGKESLFHKYSDHPPTLYKPHPIIDVVPGFMEERDLFNYVDIGNNDSYQNSVLLEEVFFNNDKKALQVKRYNYESEVTHTANNIKTFKWTSSASRSMFITDNLYFLYKTKAHNYRLKSVQSKEYFGNNLTDEFTSTTNFTYTNNKVSLPSVIEDKDSEGITKKTNLFYPSDVMQLNYNGIDRNIINDMQNNYQVAELIRSENYKDNKLLEAKQVYFNSLGLPKIISNSKGAGENALEERLIIDSYFNTMPALVSLKDGTKTKYEYNNNLQVIAKIENYTQAATGNPSNEVPCSFQQAYPQSMVTTYEYDPITTNLIKVTDPKCNVTTFNYDSFGRLKFVQDNEGNILSENEYKFID